MLYKDHTTENFEKLWHTLCGEICQAIYIKPEVQKLKASLQKNGFLNMAEKSEFIELCDKTKYEYLEAKFGGPDSEQYKKFVTRWKQWFEQKGTESDTHDSQKNSVDHIMFGSTPDPSRFLLNFEQEILGSMQDNNK